MECRLDVDLNAGKVSKKAVDGSFAKKYLGAKGFVARTSYDEIPAGIDPLSSDNRVVIAIGPFTGTSLFSPHYYVGTKSPLTGGYLDSGCGGHLGGELKMAGVDVIVISGRSEKPVYLAINDDKVEIMSAEKLWGHDAHTTAQTIMEELGSDFRVAAIGTAGENLVRFACVSSDFYWQAGRGGVGAVFGSKRLKAIAVKGTKKILLREPGKLLEKFQELHRILVKDGEVFPKYGTMWLVDPMNDNDMLPTRNFQRGEFEHADKINGDYMRNFLFKNNFACYLCPIPCGKICEVKDEKHGQFIVGGPDYETTALLGSNCGLDRLETIAYLNLLCDKLGIDTISAGGVIAFAMELYERGIIGREDTGGLELVWGDGDTMVELIHRIARREGFGAVLAEGVKRAAEKIGKGADRYAMHVKGIEIPAYDPRGTYGIGLALATSDGDARQMSAWTMHEKTMSDLNRYSTEKKAEFVVARQRRKACIDSLGVCEQMELLPIYADILSLLTGWEVKPVCSSVFPKLIEDFQIDGDVVGVGERIRNLCRAFNIREGFRRQHDSLPERFFTEPLIDGNGGRHFIDRSDFEKMLSEYYALTGCEEDGVPKKEKLESLGLTDLAQSIEVHRRSKSQ